MILVDSHCHLDYNSLSDNLEAVLKRASTQGVGVALTIGTTLAGFERVRTIAEQNETVFCSVGVHPHEAAGATDVTLDRQGRIVVPQHLRDHAGIGGDVVVVGLGSRLEIWNRSTWQTYLKKAAKSAPEIAEQIEELSI